MVVRPEWYHPRRLELAGYGVREGAQSRKWGFGIVDEQLVLHLQYRDLLNRSHDTYYTVQVVGGGTRMPDAEGKALMSKWQSARRLELAGLAAEELMKLVSAVRNHRE